MTPTGKNEKRYNQRDDLFGLVTDIFRFDCALAREEIAERQAYLTSLGWDRPDTLGTEVLEIVEEAQRRLQDRKKRQGGPAR